MNWPLPVRVVGVGSPLGDDAVAWEVVRGVQGQKQWRPEIEFHALEGGQRLLDILDGRGSLVLIDASASRAPPGTIERMEWPDARIAGLRPGTTHHLRPVEALELAGSLGLLPGTVVIWTIAGERFDMPAPAGDNAWTEGLSPAVAAAVPQLVQRLAAELETVPERGIAEHA